MTEQEKEALKSEIVAEITEKFKGTAIREDVQGTLKDAREKWFKDVRIGPGIPGIAERSPMFQAFGNYTYWSVWEHIRKLTCFICGHSYVRHLEGDEMANDIADRLCQIVYDLRLEHESGKQGQNESNV